MANDPPYIDEPPEALPAKPTASEAVGETRKPPPPRSFNQKMLQLSWLGWVQLGLVCFAVGVLLNLAQIDFTSPGFTPGRALSQLVQGIFRGLGWLVSTGWWPLLSGMVVVLPVWLAWRALSALWRK
jgi:hypothetical protein